MPQARKIWKMSSMKYTEEILCPRTTQTVKNLLLPDLLMKTMAPEND